MKAPIMTHISQHPPIPFSLQNPFFSFSAPQKPFKCIYKLTLFPNSIFILGTENLRFRKYFRVNLSAVPTVYVCIIISSHRNASIFPVMMSNTYSLFSVLTATTYIQDFTTSPPFSSYY